MANHQYPTFDKNTVAIAQELFDGMVEAIRQLNGIDEALDAGVDQFTNQLMEGLADTIFLNARVIPQLTQAWGSSPKDVHHQAVLRAKR